MVDWWQDAVALAIAALAAAWLIHRAVFTRRPPPCGAARPAGADGFVALGVVILMRWMVAALGLPAACSATGW